MSNAPKQLNFSSILASSVHDMKNSVGMLLGALDEITGQCGPKSCTSHASITQLQYEGKRLNSNLVQVLTLYRISDSQYALNITENDVSEVLEECFLENEGLLSLKGIEFEMSCDEDLAGFFDRELIGGVLNSVINNAYKYTRDKIRIGARRENGYLALYVEENGNGYPEHMLKGGSDVQHGVDFKSGSTGLGLFFTATIARMHRHQDRTGYIATSNDGIDGGGRFTLYLP